MKPTEGVELEEKGIERVLDFDEIALQLNVEKKAWWG